MKSKYTDDEISLILKLSDNEVHFIKELNNKLPTLRYIDGYVNSEEKVILQCKKCGDVFTRNASIVRAKHYHKFRCINCQMNETKERKQKDKILSYINKLIKEYDSKLKKEYTKLFNEIKRNTYTIKQCKICNEELITNTNKTICDKCRTKNKNKKHSNKKLNKLFIRDNGICHICNKLCDYNDYVVRDKTIICGNNYPSIDHIIPISKGGTDDWNNLKLAHRYCNSVKGSKMVN